MVTGGGGRRAGLEQEAATWGVRFRAVCSDAARPPERSDLMARRRFTGSTSRRTVFMWLTKASRAAVLSPSRSPSSSRQASPPLYVTPPLHTFKAVTALQRCFFLCFRARFFSSRCYPVNSRPYDFERAGLQRISKLDAADHVWSQRTAAGVKDLHHPLCASEFV